MTISIFRPGRRVGAGTAAILATLALTAVPSPAHAEDGQPILAVSNATDANIDNSGSTVGFYLYNFGDAPATDVTVTYDGSALTDDVLVSVPEDVEGCRQTDKTVTCEHNGLLPGQTDLVYAITLASRAGSTLGPAGNLDVVIKGSGPDGTVTTGSWESPVTIIPTGPDLVAAVEEIGSEQAPVGPGDTRPIHAALINKGDTAVQGFFVTVSLPTGASFAERYADCVYSIDWPGEPPAGYIYGPASVTCKAPLTLQPDEGLALFDPVTGEAVFNALFGKNLAGPNRAYGSVEVGLLDEQQLPDARARVKVAGDGPSFADKVTELRAKGREARATQLPDQDSSDNVAEIGIWTKPNSHDFEVRTTAVTGEAGDTVNVPYTITNHGPSDGAAGWEIVAPSGTVLLPSERCFFHDAQGEPVGELAKVRCSTEGEWPAKASGSGVVSSVIRVKIKSAPGTNGSITVRSTGPSAELKPENNTAKIVINEPSGGGGGAELPITGARTGLIGGIGAGILVLGVALVLLAGRRRDVVLPPSE